MAKTVHIAAISIPASFSHQASILEFCKRLVHLHHHFHVTCIFPTIDTPNPSTLTLLKSLPNSAIDFIFLPPINKQHLPQDVPPVVQIQLAMSQSIPSFRNVLKSLCSSTTPLVALVTDPFADQSLEIAKEFNLLSYIYFPPSAMTLSLLLHLPTLHEELFSVSSCDRFREDIHIPGCVPINGQDLPDDIEDRSGLAYELALQRGKRFSLADGFLVNSFLEMEEATVRALQERNNDASVYLVGPLIQTGPSNESNGPGSEYCVRWLENQRPNSVLYVSFGSSGALSQQQLNELALGLELSGHKFLWVLRAPSDSAIVLHFNGAKDNDPLQFLPQGFLKRTKGQGLVVPFWAPQTQILGHFSVGGFLTHCGWNSILESIVFGVPMITWPLFAEQRMNAVLLTEGLKVALRPEFNENGIAEREEIAKVIQGLMLGEERNGIRQRIADLKDAAANALKEDGSSTKALFQFGTENFKMQPLK
ncbi:UDP-glycosyltransferase family, conserved site [Sesbania bispinosa]|nr:UDP-glycosyltransferase family, conserved site [Sesbania bispinosa]